ncbi:MAG: hypothetical protein JRI70_09005 [Deltaproteobacteria bacterium]|nr:hypothetical protein [Deltaproteobacteria bacterium]MBW2171866.1 hypothetical protein [Deltaproteobacteria bacterium]
MDYQSNPRGVTIKTVDGQALSGKINLGINERLSDIFVRDQKPFIILFDVTFDGGGEGKVLFVNKSHIIWAEPEK